MSTHVPLSERATSRALELLLRHRHDGTHPAPGLPAAPGLSRVDADVHALLGTAGAGRADRSAPPSPAALGDAIGLSPAQLAAFRPEWCSDVTSAGPRAPDRAGDAARLAALGAYVDGLVTAKRAQDADDLLGRLVRARDDGRLTDSELASAVARLLVAAARCRPGDRCTKASATRRR